MNTLIITAHPASWGFTHTIASRYQEEREHQGGTVQLIDLYQDRQQPFLSFEDMEVMETTPEQAYYQEKISWADELVMIYPSWWMWMPAIMKNWIDWNFASDFAFRFVEENGKVKQEKLLQGKTVRFFVTGDGPGFLYALVRPMYKMILGQGVMGFCGIKCVSFDIFADMVKKKNDQDRNKMLETVTKRAR